MNATLVAWLQAVSGRCLFLTYQYGLWCASVRDEDCKHVGSWTGATVREALARSEFSEEMR